MKLNLSKCEGFSTHRSGWSYAIKSLMPFHSKSGIFFDDFLERKFIWNRHKDNSFYNFPWVGVIHLPIHDRAEFDKRNSLQFLCNQPNFIKSLKYCKCIITLSKDLCNVLKNRFNIFDNIPIVSVKHPTEKASKLWSAKKFLQNPSITQLGYWLRIFEYFQTDIKMIKKNIPNIKSYCMPGDLKRYSEIWNNIMMNSGHDYCPHEPINLNNSDFDEHLSKTLVWCCLWNTAANNGIIEPLIRNTPIFVNKLPAIVEYLGPNYPLYNEYCAISLDKIIEANEYLSNLDKTDLSGEFFANDLITKIEDAVCHQL